MAASNKGKGKKKKPKPKGSRPKGGKTLRGY